MSDEYTPTTDEVRNNMALGVAVAQACADDGHPELPQDINWPRLGGRPAAKRQFDAWLAAHDQALREQIEQQMIERAYFHIAWEKGLTIVPAGHGRAKVPPHWVEAATARLTPYLDIIRGEGSE